jgi:hypothetical protein
MRPLSRLAMLAAMSLSLAAIGSTRSLAADAYEIAVIPPPIGGGPTMFRLNVTTGQVSLVSVSPSTDVTDPQPIPAGTYRLYSTEPPDNKSFWLYRLETQSGRTWYYSNNSWIEVPQGK